MTDAELEKLKFPIGRFQWVDRLSVKQIKHHAEELKNFPAALEEVILGLKPEDFKKYYRPGGWQIYQLIHHLADSHIHVYIRFKLALNQETPAILDYDQDKWAIMPDALDLNLESSMSILKGVHHRWVALIETLDTKELERQYYHSARDKYYPLSTVLALYAWHGQHHLAHIRNIL
tara:strand:+ start:3426 stop:3953 length:528 start_codon:yes stop_codon:yes gene_type:complete